MSEWDQFPEAVKAPAASEWDAFPVAHPVTANKVVRSAASGVPVIGGVLNKLDAATNAALAPVLNPLFDEKDQLKEPTFAGRYAHSLSDQQKMDRAFEEEHPIIDAAAKVAGGVGSGGALLKAAPTVGARVLGLGGESLPAQVVQGAASGAGIGAADAAVRGEDPIHAAETGGIIGAAAPAVARGVGSVVDSLRNVKQPAAIPANTVDIAGVPVRRSMGQLTGDADTQMLEQGALRNTSGQREQQVAQDFFDAQKGDIDKASKAVASRFDPNGDIVAENPQDAASVLLDSLGKKGQAEAAEASQRGQALTSALRPGLPAEPINTLDAAGIITNHLGNARALESQRAQQLAERVNAQGEALRGRFNSNGGQVIASNPMEAANILSGAVGHAAETAQQATNQAYGALRELPGTFHPATFNSAAADIRASLNRGENPIRVDAQRTPQAHAALDDLDEMLSNLRQHRDPETGRIMRKPEPTTPQLVETTRQRLNTFLGDALSAARSSNNWSDVRAVRGVIDAFDDHVAGRLAAGTFRGGDPQAVIDAMQNARALHLQYRRTFTSQGAGDQVGQAIQKIVGRYEGQASPPEEVRNMLYGKGGLPVKIAQRLVNMFGAQSPEVGAVKQGLFAHLTEEPGLGRLPAGETADRIDQFLASSTLPQIYLSAAERRGLADYATSLRGTVAPRAAPTDQVARILPRLTGEAGGQPMTAQEAADVLFGRGSAGDNPTGVKLAEHIRDTQGADSPAYQALRQGLFSKLHGADSGETAGNIREFLTGRGRPMAQAAFAPQERAALSAYGEAHAADAVQSAKPVTQVDKIMARLTGTDGHAPPTTSDVVQYLNTTKGVSRPVQLVQRLKSEFGEDSKEISALKQGQWSYLTENKTGPLDVGSRQTASRIKEFLDGSGKPLAQMMYSQQERELIRSFGDLIGRITPVPGTVNYSNTAATLGKMMRGSIDGIFAGAGFHLAGPLGLAAGKVGNSAQNVISDLVKASKVARSLYGTPNQAIADRNLMRAIQRLTTVTARGSTSAAA